MSDAPQQSLTSPGLSTYPLFSRYPLLRAGLSRVPLGLWPTPVERLDGLAERLGVGQLWVKREDVSATPYGGNKIRKLELLLGEALAHGSREVVTFGAAGSNHALATAIYARRMGMAVTTFLTPQPNARYVRRNLLAQVAAGATVRYFEDREAALNAATDHVLEQRERTGSTPYVIPMGGTSPLGVAGVVNAGLELGVQVASGLLPAPDIVYVPFGSMGTAVGVTLGLALAGLPTRVRAVRVVPDSIADKDRARQLAADTIHLLADLDASVPAHEGVPLRMDVVEGFLGDGYASFTRAGMDAIRVARASGGLTLDGTYTGKTLSALAAADDLKDAVVLYWHTYNSHDMAPLTQNADAALLPPGARAYFESDIQPLDAAARE